MLSESMEQLGYTWSAWQRPELLHARRWRLVESHAEQKYNPREVAIGYVAFMSSLEGEMRKGVAAGFASKSLDASKDAIISSDARLSDELKEQVRLELDDVGWAELYELLRAEHEGALKQSGDSRVCDAKTCANVAREDEGRGSRTARGTAYLRAVAHACGFGPDAFAGLLPGVVSRDVLAAIAVEFRKTGYALGCGPRTLERVKEEPWNVMLDSLLYVHTRTCFMDDVVLQFVTSFPTCNVVLLGAGFDLRFYRLSLPISVRLWEVDTAASQHAKSECVKDMLSAHTLPSPVSTVQYVSCDFQEKVWLDVLIAAGLSVVEPTIVVWEGVCHYLARDVVISTLRAFAVRFSATPSAIAFDYPSPRLLKAQSEKTETMGEPWLFGIEPNELEELISSISSDLRILDHLSQEECAERYMPRKTDGSFCGVAAPYKCFIMVGNSSEGW